MVFGDRRWITNLHYAFQDDNFLVSHHNVFVLFQYMLKMIALNDGPSYNSVIFLVMPIITFLEFLQQPMTLLEVHLCTTCCLNIPDIFCYMPVF